MATLITAIIGWVLVSFLHLHYLGRDEVARKKDSVQDELQSLADWALDSSKILSNSAELNEEYLSSKIYLLELRIKELYGQYFCVEVPYEFEALHVDVETVDKNNIDGFQVQVISIIYNWRIGVEADYDVYFKNESFKQRLKDSPDALLNSAVVALKKPVFLIFFSSVVLSFLTFTFLI